MFLVIFIVAGVILEATSKIPPKDRDNLQLQGCNVGDIIQNECNKCICTQKHIYECKSKACPKITVAKRNTWRKNRSCQPYIIYNQLSTICICKPDGRWPHESCIDVFRSLPASKIVQRRCTPKGYIHVDCNVCWCDEDGQIDRCTKNECSSENQGDPRRNSISSDIFGDCSWKQWYSLAPCQFCYCLSNNKLVCNTGHHSQEAFQLGVYNFTQCGTELLKGMLDLVPQGKSAARALALRSGGRSPPKQLELEYDQSLSDKHKGDDSSEKSDKDSSYEVSHKRGSKNRDSGDRSTKLPYDDDVVRDKRRPSDDESSSEAEPEVVTKRPRSTSTSSTKRSVWTTSARSGGGSFLSALIPSVIGQMFNMRKTVVLDTKTMCEPESHFTVKCNHCYCMKNGKLMCTNNTCT